jgi:IclR family acetate operon transcriptional repressor
VRLFIEVGQAIPAHTSGSGKALLAWRSPEDLATLLDGGPLAASTPRTLTDVAALRNDLAVVRRQGYATDDEEHELGVACVATPVLDGAGQALAAISVTGPAPRIDAARLAGLLREHARQVSAAL